MTEIYRDTTNAVSALLVGTATAVKFTRNGVDTAATLSVSPPNAVTVPYSITHIDGKFSTVWTYTVNSVSYTREDENEVVTPYFTQAELIAHDSDMSTLSGSDVVRLERLVRGIINAYTGQTFGLESNTLECFGNGDSILLTEKRVVSIESIAESSAPTVLFTNTYRPVNKGYALEKVEPSLDDSIKVPAAEEAISNPFNTARPGFRNNAGYLVKGMFGWNAVPYDVNLAALLLAEEFSCDETLWRDRYLKSISGDGFDVEYRSEAFSGTGSVTADQLLGKFIANKLAII